MDVFGNQIFQKQQEEPLYQTLYQQIRQAILSGELKAGSKLPSTRGLADGLNISRNTVLNAYRQLLDEGYLEGRGGSGTYVAAVLPETLLTVSGSGLALSNSAEGISATDPVLSQRAAAQNRVPFRLSAGKRAHPFLAQGPGLDVFPYKLWSRLVIRAARRRPETHFGYQDPSGYQPLREAIAAHVAVSRQVHCTPEQVMIVPGAQAALDLAARMLVNEGDLVWIEDPGYSGARGAFLGAGARLIPVPVDEEGLVVKAGTEQAPQARLVYVTPSHQYPLGVTMSIARRLQLLDWAKSANAFILEDDYDSEFRYSGRPLAALQGLDDSGRVIYVGTFSKVLFPALRTGYLILPSSLVEPFRNVRRLIDFHSTMLEQAVLADFLTEGHFDRHIRRMRTVYAERRAVFLEGAQDLPLEIYAPQAGMHCVGWLPKGLEERKIAAMAPQYDLALTPISTFSLKPQPREGILFGYGSFTVQEIKNGVRRLKALFRAI